MTFHFTQNRFQIVIMCINQIMWTTIIRFLLFSNINRVESIFGESKRFLAKQTKRSGKEVLGLEEQPIGISGTKEEEEKKMWKRITIMPQ